MSFSCLRDQGRHMENLWDIIFCGMDNSKEEHLVCFKKVIRFWVRGILDGGIGVDAPKSYTTQLKQAAVPQIQTKSQI